jgi:cytochrome c553
MNSNKNSSPQGKVAMYFLVFLLPLGFSGIALAEPSSMVAFDAPTRALLKSGDVSRGEALTKEKKCTKCHGDAGIAEDDDEVNLAGQIPSYILKQLLDYKSEHREERSMKKAVRKLNQQDMADLAQYYGSLPLPEPAHTITGDVMKLVKKGDHTRMLKSCNSCHGQNGQGDAFETPSITGQKITYFIDTIIEMQDDDRSNDIYSRMRIIAKVLTEQEIEALAAYYAQPPQEE